MPRRSLVVLLLIGGLLASCRSSAPPDGSLPAPEVGPTVVRVDNRGYLDMTVYVLDGGRRIRLGIANGHRVTPLTVPSHLVQGTRPLRFECDPIGGRRVPVSDEIVVQPGDEVTLIIPAG